MNLKGTAKTAFMIVGLTATGFGLGLGIGFLTIPKLLSKRLQKQNDEALQDAIDKTSAAYHSKIEAIKRELEVETDIPSEAKAEEYKSHAEDPEEPEKSEEVAESPAPEEKENDEIDVYAIGIANFMQDASYTKKYLTYYRGDDYLIDDSDEEVDRYAALGDMGEWLGDYSGNIMYIRNENTACDYQIDFNDGEFGGGD